MLSVTSLLTQFELLEKGRDCVQGKTGFKTTGSLVLGGEESQEEEEEEGGGGGEEGSGRVKRKEFLSYVATST